MGLPMGERIISGGGGGVGWLLAEVYGMTLKTVTL